MDKAKRRLAAVMFTDIVGYTEQMSMNENKAFALIKKKRKLLLPIVKKHKGKLIKEMSFDYERGIVKKVIRQAMEDMESNPKMLTRDYIDAIIKDLEDLKISDF